MIAQNKFQMEIVSRVNPVHIWLISLRNYACIDPMYSIKKEYFYLGAGAGNYKGSPSLSRGHPSKISLLYVYSPSIDHFLCILIS